jgi:hypothetical protein
LSHKEREEIIESHDIRLSYLQEDIYSKCRMYINQSKMILGQCIAHPLAASTSAKQKQGIDKP